ncbi:type II secretion system F family protein [Candidatus Woesearchaeota archaeon]|nr:type II secretion system F family protein [Candidatus Woesearchaeota archaeon]
MPTLNTKLKKAGIDDTPAEFIKKTFLAAFYMATGIIVFLFLILAKYNLLKGILFIFVPILFIFLFFYMLKFPDIKIEKKEKEISKEIVFAGRYLIIELESGVALYNALVNISKNYESIGKYFKEITDKVDLGTPLEEALNEAVEFIPSDDFRRILWQILNSLRTGSDVGQSLNAVIEQIVKEQTIKVNTYGRKLNPLAMFYMIIAIILPSLGVTMLIILSSFVEFELNMTILMVIACFLGFIQFMFMSIIKFSRPAIDF